MMKKSKYPEEEKITDALGPIKSKGHDILGEGSETGSSTTILRGKKRYWSTKASLKKNLGLTDWNMEVERPKDIKEYKNWMYKEHKFAITNITENHYDAVTDKIIKNFQKHIFWTDIISQLPELNGTYLVKTGYPLLVGNFSPDLLIKPFESFLLKTFRRNILENDSFPNEPKEGWILPSNWYSRIDDIVRTYFVVKYLDGVEYFIENMEKILLKNNIENEISFEAKEEGYYAAHLKLKCEVEIPTLNFETEKITTAIEVQVTTQLQEIIKKLLHKHYEDRRKSIEKPHLKWQWDYKSDEFSTNYLGHILHYIEGMIVDIREKQRGDR